VANVRNSNTFFIDTAAADQTPATTGNLSIFNIKVTHITMTATAATSLISLKDVTTDAQKFIFRLDIVDKTQEFDFADNPIVFPNGIHPETVTDCVVTCVIRETRS